MAGQGFLITAAIRLQRAPVPVGESVWKIMIDQLAVRVESSERLSLGCDYCCLISVAFIW